MKKIILVTLTALGIPALGMAASITLTASDNAGQTSFNTGLHWSDATPPSAVNTYGVGDFVFRTPPDGASYTFGGSALTISNAGAYPQGLLLKGTGTAGIVTITNLIVNGGRISHANGVADVMNLAGNLTVVTAGELYAKQGNINFLANLSGTGNLLIPQTDAPGEDNRYVSLFGNNTGFTGKISVAGRLRILSEESLGGNPAIFTADQLTLDNANSANGGWLAVTNSVVLNDSNRGITVNSGGRFSVADSNATLTVAVPITGGGLLTKTGAGALTLSGNNDFSGGLTVTAGAQLNLNSATAPGFGTLTLASAGMKLDNTRGSAVTVTTGNPQTWNSSFTFLGSSDLNMGVGGVTLGANITATVSNNNLTVGYVSGGFALTKQGAGTLTIDGGGYYTGNTTVSDGTLTLATVNSLSSPVITVSSNATLNTSGLGLALAYGQTLTGGGTVVGTVTDGSGASSIAPGAGAGTLTINGNLALSGGSTLNFELTPTPTVGSGVNDLIVVNGALSFGNTSGNTTLNIIGSTGSGATYTLFQYSTFSGDLANVTVPAGFVLTNNTANNTIQLVSSHVAANLTWRGDGAANAWDINTTANWIQSGTNQFFFNSDNVTFDNSGSNNVAVTLASDVSPAAVIVNAAQNYTFSGSGITAGTLTKSGSGTLVLDNTNSYSGATVINGGILQLGDSSGAAGGTTYGASGSMGTGPVTNNGSLVFSRANDLTLAANINGSGNITNLGSSGTVTLSGTVSGGAVTMAGAGSLRLSGSNDYTGLTVVSSGTLSVQHTNALGAAAAGTIVDGGTLYFDLNQPMVFSGDTITLQNNGTMARGGAQAVTLLSPVVVAATGGRLQVDGGSTMTLSNELSGAGAIEKLGSGTLVLAASNSFSGGLTTSSGTLMLSHSNALGNSQLTVTSTTGGVGLSGTRVTLADGVSIPASKSLALPSSGPGTVRSTLFATGAGVTNVWAGPITLTGDYDPLNSIGFGVDSNSVFVIGGNITTDSSFAGRLLIRGNATGVGIITGTVTLSPATATLIVDDGSTWVVTSTGNTWATNYFAGNSTLRVGANNALPTASALFLGNSTANRLDLGGFNQQLGGMDVTGVNVTNSSATADSTLTYSAAGASTFGGLISDGTRKLNLNLAAGTLILTNAASLNLAKSTVTVAAVSVLQLDYTGTNQVNALVLNGVSQAAGYYSTANASPYLAGTGYLLVQPGPSAPATLTNSVSGNTLSLSWPAGQGWRLQAQTNSLASGLSTNWFDVPGSAANNTNVITINPTNPTVFYRLRY